jgi:uncharacterized small protein (DUF1192 family)
MGVQMIEDEDRRSPATSGAGTFRPAALDGWSEEALRDYLVALKAEIARAEATLRARADQRALADRFFRGP